MEGILKSYLFHTHEEYLSLLRILKDKTMYIQIVIIEYDGATGEILDLAKKHMQCIGRKRVKQWPGTQRKGKGALQYEFIAKKCFIEELEKYESFFINETNEYGWDEVRTTDFGLDDIAFFDVQKEILFYTTTHEGYAFGREDLLSLT